MSTQERALVDEEPHVPPSRHVRLWRWWDFFVLPTASLLRNRSFHPCSELAALTIGSVSLKMSSLSCSVSTMCATWYFTPARYACACATLALCSAVTPEQYRLSQ